MSEGDSFKEFIVEQMAGFGEVTIRTMFGGQGVFHNGLMFGLIHDQVLYLKADDSLRSEYLAENSTPFTYPRKGKRVDLGYFRAPSASLDDGEEMARWCRKSFAVALKANAGTRAKK